MINSNEDSSLVEKITHSMIAKKYLIMAFSGILFLEFMSCFPRVKYIVLDNVPDLPVLTVFPASMSRNDISAANWITELLISCGVKIIERPVMLKERSEYEGTSSGSAIGLTGSGQVGVVGGGASQKGELATSIDPIALIKETNADYVFIVQDQKGMPWVKMIKRSDGQILYAGLIGGDAVRSESEQMLYFLKKAGILK